MIIILFVINLIPLIAGIWAILFAFRIIGKNVNVKIEMRRKRFKWVTVAIGTILIFIWVHMIFKALVDFYS